MSSEYYLHSNPIYKTGIYYSLGKVDINTIWKISYFGVWNKFSIEKAQAIKLDCEHFLQKSKMTLQGRWPRLCVSIKFSLGPACATLLPEFRKG